MNTSSKLGIVLWLTGLSGSGKSTLAQLILAELQKLQVSAKVIDGDSVRSKLHKHLGFSREDIIENNRLIAEYCKDHLLSVDVQLVPVIAPFNETRKNARQLLDSAYIEVYVKASLETCINRDTKGLYAKAQKGELPNLIGFDPNTPYEVPDNPDLIIDTEHESEAESVAKVLRVVTTRLGLNHES